MKRAALFVLMVVAAFFAGGGEEHVKRVEDVSGLVALWHFSAPKDGVWWSSFDKGSGAVAYPLYLRKIGDPKRYTLDSWCYDDEESGVRVDKTGPFGHALYFNKGYIYAESPRESFDKGALDLNGKMPFTMVAWVKFTGSRHMIAGIWDEGGWHKHRGRRQAALFAGLFGRAGVTAHISTTGASSYPQSDIEGSQYARERALDGADFKNDEWVCTAMTYDPVKGEVVAWLNGVATPLVLSDPVKGDVYKGSEPFSANPFLFAWRVYSPRRFTLKYTGYDVATSGVYEHWLEACGEQGEFVYGRRAAREVAERFKVKVSVKRGGGERVEVEGVVEPGTRLRLPGGRGFGVGCEIVTALFREDGDEWVRVGGEIDYPVVEGAPFTLGRALGLGSDERIGQGSQLFVDGVAVFNRVLSAAEMRNITFVE